MTLSHCELTTYTYAVRYLSGYTSGSYYELGELKVSQSPHFLARMLSLSTIFPPIGETFLDRFPFVLATVFSAMFPFYLNGAGI